MVKNRTYCGYNRIVWAMCNVHNISTSVALCCFKSLPMRHHFEPWKQSELSVTWILYHLHSIHF